MKKSYLVLVCEHPCITLGGMAAKPKLPDGVRGYAPIYSNKRAAKKDWPKAVIRELEDVKP